MPEEDTGNVFGLADTEVLWVSPFALGYHSESHHFWLVLGPTREPSATELRGSFLPLAFKTSQSR